MQLQKTGYNTTFDMPKCIDGLLIPSELVHSGLAPLAQSTLIAGLYADSVRNDPAKFGVVAANKKAGSDIVTIVDKDSEEIMANALLMNQFIGIIRGEEDTNYGSAHPGIILVASLDGLDGSDNYARILSLGYAPSAGILRNENGLLVPHSGAFFLPREGMGYAASLDNGKAFGYKVNIVDGKCKVEGIEELAKFDQDRIDQVPMYNIFPTNAGDALPNHIDKAAQHFSKDSNGTYGLRSLLCSVQELSLLIKNEGTLWYGAEDIRYHDIGGALPVVIVQGGGACRLDGEDISGFAKVENADRIAKISMKPMIIYTNKHSKEAAVKAVK